MSRFDLSIIVDDLLEKERKHELSGSLVSLAGPSTVQAHSSESYFNDENLPSYEEKMSEKGDSINRHDKIRMTWQYLASKLYSSSRTSTVDTTPMQNEPIGLPFNNLAAIQEGYIRLCVSGKIFEIAKEKLLKFPDSLFCSPKFEKHYKSELGMYFLDRNRSVFEFIHQQLYCDKNFVEFPKYLPAELIELELEFYGIGWRYFMGTFKEFTEDLAFNTFHEKTFAFFNYPEWKCYSKIYMILDIIMIMVSIVLFIVETDPYVDAHRTTGNALDVSFKTIDWICMLFFTFDLTLNFLASLDRYTLIKGFKERSLSL